MRPAASIMRIPEGDDSTAARSRSSTVRGWGSTWLKRRSGRIASCFKVGVGPPAAIGKSCRGSMTTWLQGLIDGVDAISRWITGGWGGGSTYPLSRWVFLRAVGIIYLIAFVSLWVQVKGLIGAHGILPAQDYLGALRGMLGPERYRLAPTVFWLGASDTALQLACAAGATAAVLVMCDVLPAPTLLILWALYLSFETVGQDFLAFQWDVLLLEAGLLAVLYAPWSVVPGRGVGRAAPAVPLVLLWWLLFRHTFESGIVKLLSGDPTWRNLSP